MRTWTLVSSRRAGLPRRPRTLPRRAGLPKRRRTPPRRCVRRAPCTRLAVGCGTSQARYRRLLLLQDDLRLLQVVPLHVARAELEQHGHRIRVLDALGNRRDLALLGRLDEAAHLLLQRRVRREALHERAVDLEVLHRRLLQHAHRVPADAEMLDGEREAVRLELLRRRARLLQILRDVVLADLEADRPG